MNNYVADRLINWEKPEADPMFITIFPQKGMLREEDYQTMAGLFRAGADNQAIKNAANQIRLKLNPHPAGQQEYNTPLFEGKHLNGVQHKYRQTILLFPQQGQNCHAFCTFCFRWPQFTGIEELKIASCGNHRLSAYIKSHPEITDVLITGGDPLIMKTRVLAGYIEPFLSPELSNITTIRIGTRALSYWPYRFLTDDDSDELLKLFSRIRKAGKHLAFMAQFNHPNELETEEVKQAITRIQEAGAIIRTQSPLLNHINADANIWAEMWQKQVSLNCIPY
ncbi:MAG: hypothetical protein PHX97_06055, partial [Dehalococcoidales bacterium]|nr:hypothetical protein [Dehalococcoidales bacterium]